MNNALRNRFSVSLALLALCPISILAQTTSSKPNTQAKDKSSGATKSTVSTRPAPTPPESVMTVTVHPLANVTGETFTLGEIADIEGKDKDLAAQLAEIQIGASPLPGLSRGVMPGDVTVHLRAVHLDIKRVHVSLPPGIRITRSGTDVAPVSVVKAALAAAQDAIKSIPNATLEALPTNTTLIVPTGKVDFLAGAWRGQVESGTIFVPVSILVNGKIFQTPEISIRIHRKQKVVVARDILAVHTVLTPNDVMLATIDLPPGFTQPFSAIEDVVGKRMTRRLMAEAPLSATMLDTPPAITANDKVTIEYHYGPIHITASGVARQTGMIGDHIRVYATETHKELDAVIVDNQTVSITDP